MATSAATTADRPIIFVIVRILRVFMACQGTQDLAQSVSPRHLTVKLNGRAEAPDQHGGRTISCGARGGKRLTPHGPLRLLGRTARSGAYHAYHDANDRRPECKPKQYAGSDRVRVRIRPQPQRGRRDDA